MKSENLAKKITEKINVLTDDRKTVISGFRIIDESVQAELRLSASWSIRRPVDEIQYPKDLSGKAGELWSGMSRLAWEITKTVKLLSGKNEATLKINSKKKTGPSERTEAKNQFIIASGKQFLADYKSATSKSNIKMIDKKIADLQGQQKALLPELRKSNSDFCAQRKNAKTEQGKKNAAALISGRFWEADETAIKGYFHPPFDKNYLADVSEKWRAALFVECQSVSYKRYSGDWGHKLAGTGSGYLCGIDDNGDEWGFEVHIGQGHDNFGDALLEGTVEQAMSNVFGIAKADLDKCTRQGDLLFCPTTIRKEDSPEYCKNCGYARDKHIEKEGRVLCSQYGWSKQYYPIISKALVLTSANQWEPRSAHIITSPSLKHNGVYFCAENDITVTHTSHASVTLPAGEYRLYMSQHADDQD
jgi:hypothetical protein